MIDLTEIRQCSKSLEIVVQRRINTYLNLALPLCAILVKEENEQWFYQHFFKTFMLHDNNKTRCRLYFMENDLFYTDIADQHMLTADEMQQKGEIIAFIKEKINTGFYIILQIDEYYLPDKLAYNREHYIHQILIFGYNDLQQEFETISFDKNQDFKAIPYAYAQIEAAYHMAFLHPDPLQPWAILKNAELLKLKNDIYSFKLSLFLKDLREYITSSVTNFKISESDIKIVGDNVVYGLEVYDTSISLLRKQIKGINTFDYRFIHLIDEHKKVMYNRIEFLALKYNLRPECGTILGLYKEIKQLSHVARLTGLKAIVLEQGSERVSVYIKDKKALEQIIEIMKDLKDKEYKALNLLYDLLSGIED